MKSLVVSLGLLAASITAVPGLAAPKTSPLNPPKNEMPGEGPFSKPEKEPPPADAGAESPQALDLDRLVGEIALLRAKSGPFPKSPPPAQWRLEDVRARAAEGEELLYAGRIDEAIAHLMAVVEHPRFDAFAEDDAGRAAVYLLGDAFATAGAYVPARAYLGRVLKTRGAWNDRGTYARRAVKRWVEMAIESQRFESFLEDLRDVPPRAPEETRGEIFYLTGRAKEAAGDPSAALAAYAQVTQRSRFWAQATYLQGLIQVERGRFKEGENLFCKVADPARQSNTTPVFADAHYFAVRDLARLGLGRIAHEQFRFDDSRYYYYLVPRDSDRLAEALYEGATGRYEKKDYEGARELLDELKALRVHHRYEDEAWILDAYVDLARCKFPDADRKLVTFVRRYEPVRDAARRAMTDERAMQSLLAAARSGADARGGVPTAGAADRAIESTRTIAMLLRIDPAYGVASRERAVLNRETSGLRMDPALSGRVDTARRELGQTETRLAKDSLARLDLRLSRLLRRARLARIESVLGRKRALEVEIEAIQSGILPAGALDSLDAARYLKDNEEYWPFEGDDWPDEFVGSRFAR